MLSSNIPLRPQIPFANSAGGGYTRPIPVASQIGIQNGAASFTDGFPPLTFVPTTGGGTPPFGQDFNGLLNQVTAWTRWQAAGGPVFYDATFATSSGANGYPKGAVLSSTTVGEFWFNTVDNNTSNPDTGGANWVAFMPITLIANDTGTADALAATMVPPVTTYFPGQNFYIKKSASPNATGAPTFNPGSGVKTITDRRGNPLNANDLPANAYLDLLADGVGWRNLGIVAADLAPISTLYNLVPFTTSTRVAMTGNAGNAYTVTPWSPGNYVKRSSTSLLMIWVTAPTFVAGGTGPGQVQLNLGTNHIPFIPSNNNAATSIGQAANVQALPGIAAGSLAVSLAFSRNDSTAWTGSFCFNSTDNALYPATTQAVILIGELGS